VSPVSHTHPIQLTNGVDSEDFFRLKKVQGKKKRDAEKADSERAGQDKEFEGKGGDLHRDEGNGGGEAGGKDMLREEKDQDVIF